MAQAREEATKLAEDRARHEAALRTKDAEATEKLLRQRIETLDLMLKEKDGRIEQIQADGFDTDFAVRVVSTSPATEIESVIRKAGDVVFVRVSELQAAPPRRSAPVTIEPAAATTSAPAADTRSVVGQARHVRIDVRRLDTLMNLIGELLIARGRLTQLAGESGQ